MTKPRPVIVLQNTDILLDSIIIIPLTTFDAEGFPIRIEIMPTTSNGLTTRSFAMCDKITAIPRKNLGEPIGSVSADVLREILSSLEHLLGEGDQQDTGA